MAKTSNSSSTTSAPTEPRAPVKVAVFNHTRHMIGIGISHRPAGTIGSGPEASTIDFLPGNNSLDMADLEKCKDSPLWHVHAEKQIRRDHGGKTAKRIDLEVGLHDPEFEVESEELGKRMFQLRQKQVS